MKQKWSNQEINTLIKLKEHNVPNRMIGKILDRSTYAVNMQVNRQGIGKKKIEPLTIETGLDSKLIGTNTESAVFIALSERGFDVFTPYMNNHKTDCIVKLGNVCANIQIKTGSYTKDDRFRAELRTKDKGNKHIKYNNKDVDFFIVKCINYNAYYILPYDIVINQPSVNLYPHRIKQMQTGIEFEQYRDAWHLIEHFMEEK
tara:strand:- start:404 stop:1009 length:606 start_codon:yes stop_codon:yes gene_type:complete